MGGLWRWRSAAGCGSARGEARAGVSIFTRHKEGRAADLLSAARPCASGLVVIAITKRAARLSLTGWAAALAVHAVFGVALARIRRPGLAGASRHWDLITLDLGIDA
ncbi:hypothetical protein F8S13_04980 [Chloroflexia bacterium SDU3-3]|nr:hypothetical protein F8S13_04980 [Chloroflexia bacterium SDU3-3]